MGGEGEDKTGVSPGQPSSKTNFSFVQCMCTWLVASSDLLGKFAVVVPE